jgi:hypothetical protein
VEHDKRKYDFLLIFLETWFATFFLSDPRSIFFIKEFISSFQNPFIKTFAKWYFIWNTCQFISFSRFFLWAKCAFWYNILDGIECIFLFCYVFQMVGVNFHLILESNLRFYGTTRRLEIRSSFEVFLIKYGRCGILYNFDYKLC